MQKFCILLGVALLLAGCGVKGPLRPPPEEEEHDASAPFLQPELTHKDEAIHGSLSL